MYSIHVFSGSPHSLKKWSWTWPRNPLTGLLKLSRPIFHPQTIHWVLQSQWSFSTWKTSSLSSYDGTIKDLKTQGHWDTQQDDRKTCVFVSVCVHVRENESVCVCVSVWEKERVYVCVCEGVIACLEKRARELENLTALILQLVVGTTNQKWDTWP